jgi:hypothetical protein
MPTVAGALVEISVVGGDSSAERKGKTRKIGR